MPNARETSAQIIDRIRTATTIDEMRVALSHLKPVGTLAEIGQWGSRQPGTYTDGRIIVTIDDQDAEHVVDYVRVFDMPTKSLIQRTREAVAEERHETELADDEPEQPETRRRGRPAIGEPVQVRLPETLLDSLDEYAARNNWTRAEAVRNLVRVGLRRDRYQRINSAPLGLG